MLSMTGFARVAESYREVKLVCETKSLNSKFLEVQFKLPEDLNPYEYELRKFVSGTLVKGKFELLIKCDNRSIINELYSKALFEKNLNNFKKLLGKDFQAPDIKRQAIFEAIKLSISSKYSKEIQEEIPYLTIRALVEKALSKFIKSRAVEGQHLYRDLIRRVKKLNTILKAIKMRQKNYVKERYLSLQARINELTNSSFTKEEQAKLALEVALALEKNQIAEEIVRATGHLNAIKGSMRDDVCGRRIDFLLQELLREFNTIASKIQDLKSQHLVVEAKSELEKIREQIQNVV
jgi:uncharacterized protein (TIGR00255 family)